jgi:hypothetical protein
LFKRIVDGRGQLVEDCRFVLSVATAVQEFRASADEAAVFLGALYDFRVESSVNHFVGSVVGTLTAFFGYSGMRMQGAVADGCNGV